MSDINTAVILAAGRGSRLKELSLAQPKPMTQVNETAIIENLIRQLIQNDIKKIVVVIGYQADKLKSYILDIFSGRAKFIFVENEIFDKTNNIYSLYLAAGYMNYGFYLFEADVFCDDIIVERLLKTAAHDIILIDKFTSEMNGTVVDLDDSAKVLNMYLNKDQTADFDFSDKYKTLNFYKISRSFVHEFFKNKLEAHISGKDVNSYYEQIIKEAVDNGYEFYGLKTENSRWWEIDTQEDLEKAELIFKK